jgi:hypothetical protein
MAQYKTPKIVNDLATKRVIAVACGTDFTVALTGVCAGEPQC